jgi:hypothetical protein
MRQLLFLGVLISSLLLITSCKKCHENELSSVQFSQNELNMIPYKGNETLVFKSTTEPFLSYNGTERITQSGIYYEDLKNVEETHCKDTYYYSQSSWIDFRSAHGDYNLRTEMYFTNLFDSGYIEGIFIFGLGLNINSIRDFSGQYVFESDTLYSGKYIEGFSKIIKGFYSTIQLGQKSYHNVYEFDGDYSSPNATEWISSVYYCFSDGLVGFRTNKGKLWYLE